MFGLAAAPEIDIAVPSVTPRSAPYSRSSRRARRPRPTIADAGRSGVHRRERERHRLAALRREIGSRNRIQRDVHDVQRRMGRALSVLGRVVRRRRPQRADRQIVALVESGERIRLSLARQSRCAKERAHETLAIHRVQREAIRVDAPREDRRDRSESEQRDHHDTRRYIRRVRGHPHRRRVPLDVVLEAPAGRGAEPVQQLGVQHRDEHEDDHGERRRRNGDDGPAQLRDQSRHATRARRRRRRGRGARREQPTQPTDANEMLQLDRRADQEVRTKERGADDSDPRDQPNQQPRTEPRVRLALGVRHRVTRDTHGELRRDEHSRERRRNRERCIELGGVRPRAQSEQRHRRGRADGPGDAAAQQREDQPGRARAERGALPAARRVPIAEHPRGRYTPPQKAMPAEKASARVLSTFGLSDDQRRCTLVRRDRRRERTRWIGLPEIDLDERPDELPHVRQRRDREHQRHIAPADELRHRHRRSESRLGFGAAAVAVEIPLHERDADDGEHAADDATRRA